jgi:hypothetical protein
MGIEVLLSTPGTTTPQSEAGFVVIPMLRGNITILIDL